MPLLVSAEVNLKFLIDDGLKDRLDRAFEAQGVSLKVGMTRLIRFFLEDGKELQAVILQQVKGDAAKAIARILLEKDTQNFQPDDINPVLHPQRPEQVLKPKKKRAG